MSPVMIFIFQEKISEFVGILEQVKEEPWQYKTPFQGNIKIVFLVPDNSFLK